MSDRILVIGAGLSGATVARVLAEAGFTVEVQEQEEHPGGHCHTYRDTPTGVMVHAHGPHILHSDNESVWGFVDRFAVMRPYAHFVRAVTGDKTYPLPITLDTINQFFGREFDAAQAKSHLSSLARRYPSAPRNFEEQGRNLLGDALYEAFFRDYTRKQWGVDPACLPASIMRRIPVRFNKDPSYFHHARVAIPEDGYTAMIEAILEHENITLSYGVSGTPQLSGSFRHTVYTGPIDAWFDYRFGRLGYRTLDFDVRRQTGTYQPVAQINYCDMSVPWTRITKHKHFAPWEHHDSTVYVTETSRDCEPNDIPYYPLRLAGDEPRLQRYLEAAKATVGTSFTGRLATYRYIDMDVAIAEALNAGRQIATALQSGQDPPEFFTTVDDKASS